MVMRGLEVKDQGCQVVYSGGISAAMGRVIGMGAVSSGLMHGGSSLGTGTTVTLLVGLVGLNLSGVGGQAGERAVTWTQAGVNGLEQSAASLTLLLMKLAHRQAGQRTQISSQAGKKR